MIDGVLDNWIVLALLAPATWALTCVADVCLVGTRCYKYVLDGPVASGMFCLVPLLGLAPFIEPAAIASEPASLLAALAGVGFAVYLLLYFAALFALNDASSAEVFGTLTVVLVPLFAWLLIDESLAPRHYVGIVLASAGAAVLVCGYLGRVSPSAVRRLLGAIVCLSMSMVLQAQALATVGYANAAFVFFAVIVVIAAIAWYARSGHRRRVAGLCRRYFWLFLVLEGLQQLAVLSSQRSTELAPSVSLVALFECLLPGFVVLFSAAALRADRAGTCLPLEARDALSTQSTALGAKGVSLALIGVAVVIAVR